MHQYLLDTDICIYLLKHRGEDLREKFNQHAGKIGVSAISLAELHFGIEKSSRPDENRRVLEKFTLKLHVLPFTEKAAQHFGQIRCTLERTGTPIGTCDLFIAAHARSEGLTVITNNEREFRRVPALEVENWTVV